MTMPGTITAPASFAGGDVESLRGRKAATLGQEKARLRKAATAFESLFMYQMLKAMRQTVGESALSKDSPMASGMGKDVFMDMFDMHLSRDMADSGTGSIADILYRSLEQVIEAEYGEGQEPVPIRPLDGGSEDRPPIPVKRHDLPVEQPGARPIKLGESPLLRPLRKNISLAPTPTGDPVLDRYGPLIDRAAEAHQVDSALVSAVIQAESSGNPKAVSPAGAKGLMQLMDTTAADLGVRKVFDPAENIDSGTRYLRQLLDRFGDTKLALAAYNAGPGTVERHRGVPPYPETEQYIEKVMDKYARYRSMKAEGIPKAR